MCSRIKCAKLQERLRRKFMMFCSSNRTSDYINLFTVARCLVARLIPVKDVSSIFHIFCLERTFFESNFVNHVVSNRSEFRFFCFQDACRFASILKYILAILFPIQKSI